MKETVRRKLSMVIFGVILGVVWRRLGEVLGSFGGPEPQEGPNNRDRNDSKSDKLAPRASKRDFS